MTQDHIHQVIIGIKDLEIYIWNLKREKKSIFKWNQALLQAKEVLSEAVHKAMSKRQKGRTVISRQLTLEGDLRRPSSQATF